MSRKELLAQIEEQANRYHLAKVTYRTIATEQETLKTAEQSAYDRMIEEQDKLWKLVDDLTEAQ